MMQTARAAHLVGLKPPVALGSGRAPSAKARGQLGKY